MLAFIRLGLLLGAITTIALSTILFRRIGQPLIGAWWRPFTRFGHEPPKFFTNPRIVRIWGLLAGVACLALYWYLGTPQGAALIAEIFAPAR
jgi:hypothetical protein